MSTDRKLTPATLLPTECGDLKAPCAVEHFLELSAAQWPDRTAIDFYDRLITYGELWTLAKRAAQGLRECGVGPGVNVGLQLPNTPHFVVSFFGVLLAGGCVVNCSPAAGMGELKDQLADSGAQVLISAQWLPQFDQIRQLAVKIGMRAFVSCSLADFLPAERVKQLVYAQANGSAAVACEKSFAELIANDGPDVRATRGSLGEEVAVLQYTGGTTGIPKGAMLTHANFAASMHILDKLAGPKQDRQFKTLAVLPFSHIFGLTLIMLRSLIAGLELVLHIRFDAAQVLGDIGRKKINIFNGVPAMYSALTSHPKFREADFSSLLGCSSAGAPLPGPLRARFQEGSQRMLIEGYALTETTCLGTLPAPQAGSGPGQVGFPAPCTVIEVVDLETGLTVLPAGEIGELCFRGPQVMKGYWNRPEETAETFRGGRFHTGDIGFIDQNGAVTLTERKKDIIFTGGHNVYPRHVERAIYEHESVAEVTVIGVPSPYHGEVAKAFVALKPGRDSLGYGELCAFLSKRLSSYEIPVELEIRDSLPKTSLGKLSKKELIAEERARRGL